MYNERKQIWETQVGRGIECKGHKETSGGDENAFILIVVDGFMGTYICQNSKLYALIAHNCLPSGVNYA